MPSKPRRHFHHCCRTELLSSLHRPCDQPGRGRRGKEVTAEVRVEASGVRVRVRKLVKGVGPRQPRRLDATEEAVVQQRRRREGRVGPAPRVYHESLVLYVRDPRFRSGEGVPVEVGDERRLASGGVGVSCGEVLLNRLRLGRQMPVALRVLADLLSEVDRVRVRVRVRVRFRAKVRSSYGPA